ncbi:lamin tail domain-containing protein [Kocuria soli]|uniref:Lamin tail domain-containing protein n=1 Tax=Kocuria soli TaxID=2485125 RepID=A0A3N4A364_9MICC|nr:lamin tail domain-containing protein [Kocuria soli]
MTLSPSSTTPPGATPAPIGTSTTNYVVVKNTGSKTLILSGYRIKDAANHTFVFPTGTKIAPGKQIMIRSCKGANTSGTLYWNQNNYVWNNTGDTLRMYSPKGALLEKCSYRGGGSTAYC